MTVKLSPSMSLLEWFMTHVDMGESSGCWLWRGFIRSGGYGYFAYGQLALAHRASWLLHCGEIPSGLFVRHKCDVKICVNPAHLELGTPKQNSQDAKDRGLIKVAGAALANTFKTHCPKGHLLVPKGLVKGRLQRMCKQCFGREYNTKYMRKRRAALRAGGLT